MDLLGKRPNLLFLIAIRGKVECHCIECYKFNETHMLKQYDEQEHKKFCFTPSTLYRNLICTNLRREVYWYKWDLIRSHHIEMKNHLIVIANAYKFLSYTHGYTN